MAFRLFLMGLLMMAVASCTGSAGSVYHTVKKGQTLYQISRVYGIDERYLARINGIEDPTLLRVGDQLFIPGADTARHVPATVATAVPPVPKDTPRPSKIPARDPGKATVPPPSTPPATGAGPAAPTKNNGKAPVMKDKFIWPVKGKILKNFGTHNKDNSKGIEIASSRGTPVVAAAAGKVTYSGNGIRGYGNLIILKHDDSFYSVYAFNEKNLARTGAYVSQGEKIAFSGIPPGGGEGRLHFEIRYGKGAVDPIFYLP